MDSDNRVPVDRDASDVPSAGEAHASASRAQWQRVENICAEAMDLPPAQRATFIDAQCGDDAALRVEVLSLVAQLDAEPDFLERPILDREPAASDEQFGAGTPIGAYQVKHLLGRGGMGEVYLATRDVDGVTQRAAVKIIRRGMSTEDVLQRFRLERRILANLQHPSVARLLDAGVAPDGRPYFVMEYVDGQSLTDYCDERRLTVRARLHLFLEICDAVQHAHQRLIVHRDIKPRNILVTAQGVPMLLDFGIGKVLDDSGDFGSRIDTRTEVRLLTPEYAAPEQIAGSPVTTATDVYALGVVLYELLTGRHPYRGATSRGDLDRVILESTPRRPSTVSSTRVSLGSADTPVDPAEARALAGLRASDPAQLRRELSGDLDTIILKALRKEPERRYPSAAALADDISRYLNGFPVGARPDTLGYRLRKLVRRNRAATVSASAIAVALVAITVVSIVQARRVSAEAQRTIAERDKAVAVRGFLLEMFGASGANQVAGDSVTVRALLDRQRAQLDQFYRDGDPTKADMLEVLAEGYDRLGLYSEAEPLARRALDLRRSHSPGSSADAALTLGILGWIIHERGRSDEAEPMLRESAAELRLGSSSTVEGLSRVLNDLGVLYNATRRYDSAVVVLNEALRLRRQRFGDAHRVVGITANNLAASFYYLHQIDSAVPLQQLAVRALQESLGPDHQRTIVALSNLAAFKREQGDLTAAELDYRELAERQTRVQGRDHPVTARILAALGAMLADRGQRDSSDVVLDSAETVYREAAGTFERRLGPTHAMLASTLERLGAVIAQRGRLAEAIPIQGRVLRIARANAPDSAASVQSAARRLAEYHRLSGDSLGGAAVLRSVGITSGRTARP